MIPEPVHQVICRHANELVRSLLGPGTDANGEVRRHADRTAFLVCSLYSDCGAEELVAVRVLAQLHDRPEFTYAADLATSSGLADALRHASQNTTILALIHACCRFDSLTRNDQLTPALWDEAVASLISELPQIDPSRIRDAVERLT